jgi:ABC-type nitrate/sulfonate/bicarbonate transport system substrate-binding protein
MLMITKNKFGIVCKKAGIIAFLVMGAVLFFAAAAWCLELLPMERVKVSVAVGPDDLFHGYIQAAMAMGLFSQHGVDSQLMVMSSGSQAAKAVIQGRSLFGIHGFEQVLLARQKELPLMAIGKAMNGTGLQIVARERSLAEAWASPKLKGTKKLSLLKGRRIGVDAADLLQGLWVQWIAGRAGLDARRDFDVLDVGSGTDGIAELTSGTVNYLVTRPPVGETIQSKGAGRIVWAAGEAPEEPGPLYLVVSMREGAWQANPDAPIKFLRALRASFVLMQQQQDYSLSAARRLWPDIPEEALRQAVVNTLPLLPQDLTLQEDEARLTMKLMLEAGLLSKKIALEEACSNWFLQ